MTSNRHRPRKNLLGDDLDRGEQADEADRNEMVLNVLQTAFGDSNLDGRFDTMDLTSVFEAGKYDDVIDGNSTWSEGDWNGDGNFNSSDLVLAFQLGVFRPT